MYAPQTGCGFGDSVGLYLLSDGKPDSSCSLLLKETERLTTGNHITIHTVSFNCTDRSDYMIDWFVHLIYYTMTLTMTLYYTSDSTANDFLKKLAHQTGGRYHCCHDNVDALSGLLESGHRDGDVSRHTRTHTQTHVCMYTHLSVIASVLLVKHWTSFPCLIPVRGTKDEYTVETDIQVWGPYCGLIPTGTYPAGPRGRWLEETGSGNWQTETFPEEGTGLQVCLTVSKWVQVCIKTVVHDWPWPVFDREIILEKKNPEETTRINQTN